MCYKCKNENLFVRVRCEKCGHDLSADKQKQTRASTSEAYPLQELLNSDPAILGQVSYSIHFWDALVAAEPIFGDRDFQLIFSEQITRKDFASVVDLYSKVKQILGNIKLTYLSMDEYF